MSEEEEVASKNDSIREGVDSLSVGDMPILKEQTTGGDDETNNKSQNQGSPRRSSLPSNPYHPDNEVESNDVESMAANDNVRTVFLWISLSLCECRMAFQQYSLGQLFSPNTESRLCIRRILFTSCFGKSYESLQ